MQVSVRSKKAVRNWEKCACRCKKVSKEWKNDKKVLKILRMRWKVVGKLWEFVRYFNELCSNKKWLNGSKSSEMDIPMLQYKQKVMKWRKNNSKTDVKICQFQQIVIKWGKN